MIRNQKASDMSNPDIAKKLGVSIIAVTMEFKHQGHDNL